MLVAQQARTKQIELEICRVKYNISHVKKEERDDKMDVVAFFFLSNRRLDLTSVAGSTLRVSKP